MMQEMYDWYMDNLFPEHRRQAVKAVEKDSRDRKKRIAKGGAGMKAVSVSVMSEQEMLRMVTQSYDGDYSGRSKWERIGKPFMLSQVDWAITLNPFDFAPGHEKRRLLALRRNIERYEESTR